MNGKGDVTISNTKSRTLPMEEAESIKSDYEDSVVWNKDLKLHYVAYGNDELGDELLAYKNSHKNKTTVVASASGTTGANAATTGAAALQNSSAAGSSTPWGTTASGTNGTTSQTSGGRAVAEEAAMNQVTSTIIPVTKETDDETATVKTDASPFGTTGTASATNVKADAAKSDNAKADDGKSGSKGVANSLANKSSTISEVWFEDEQSMALKLSLVDELHLGGFGAWRKGFETDTFRNFVYTTYREPVADTDKKTEKSGKDKTKNKK